MISSTDTGAQVMGALPGLVRQLLDEDAWADFVTPDGRPQHHDRFTDFVEASPPRGLGGRVAQLLALCGTDEELARRVRAIAMRDIPRANPSAASKLCISHFVRCRTKYRCGTQPRNPTTAAS